MKEDIERLMRTWDSSKGDRVDDVAQTLRRFYARTELCPCMQRPTCHQCELDRAMIERTWIATEPQPKGG